MKYIIFIGIFIGFLIVIRLYLNAKEKKRMLSGIRSQFVKIPDRKFNKEDIQYLQNSNNDKMDIDDITWNDLDMDKVYARINNCNSFIGEQVLYRKLHFVSENNEEMMNREKMIQEFNEKILIREEIQILLEKLGRRKIEI